MKNASRSGTDPTDKPRANLTLEQPAPQAAEEDLSTRLVAVEVGVAACAAAAALLASGPQCGRGLPLFDASL